MRAPLFILAPPRSFTSLVNAMIGQHPQMYGLPELNLFLADDMVDLWTGAGGGSRAKNPLFGPFMRHGLLRTVAQLYTGEQTIETVTTARNWVWRRRHRKTGDVYKELVERISPLVGVDKSPAYASNPQYLARILETFPDARFIHLLRHPRGQCESVMKIAGGAMAILMDSVDRSGERPVLDPQIAWYEFHVGILEFLEQVPASHQLRIQGEDFFRDTDGALQRVCRWLGVRDDATAIDPMKHPEDSPYASLGPANAILGNDINFLRSPELRPTQMKEYSTEGALSWRPDGAGFFQEVIELAHHFGYQ